MEGVTSDRWGDNPPTMGIDYQKRPNLPDYVTASIGKTGLVLKEAEKIRSKATRKVETAADDDEGILSVEDAMRDLSQANKLAAQARVCKALLEAALKQTEELEELAKGFWEFGTSPSFWLPQGGQDG